MEMNRILVLAVKVVLCLLDPILWFFLHCSVRYYAFIFYYASPRVFTRAHVCPPLFHKLSFHFSIDDIRLLLLLTKTQTITNISVNWHKTEIKKIYNLKIRNVALAINWNILSWSTKIIVNSLLYKLMWSLFKFFIDK